MLKNRNLLKQSVTLIAVASRPHFESLRVGRTKGEIETISQELFNSPHAMKLGASAAAIQNSRIGGGIGLH